MKLSPHFAVSEFKCKDGTALPEKFYGGARILCVQLELIRSEAGDLPITIVSGYRSLAHNRKVGGARASRHMTGDGADIFIPGIAPAKLHALVLRLHHEKKITIGGLGAYPGWTHVDVRGVKPDGYGGLKAPPRLIRWTGSRTAS